MVNCAGSTDFQVLTIKSPFGENILGQTSPYFGHCSCFCNFVVSYQMAEYPIRISFWIVFLHCFGFTKIFVKFRFSPLLQAS